MSRPQPKIILQGMKGRTHTEITVLTAEEYWIITYAGRPINIYTTNLGLHKGPKKYIKTGGANRAAIKNAADRLNKYFNTDQFGFVDVV